MYFKFWKITMNFLKKCPACGSKSLIVGKTGFKCKKCNYSLITNERGKKR